MHGSSVSCRRRQGVKGYATMPAVVLVAAWVVMLAATALADERIGDDILVAEDVGSFAGIPRVAGDGLGAMIVWSISGVSGVWSARVDGAGESTGPFSIASGSPSKESVSVASDGRTFFVVWAERQSRKGRIKGLRLDPSGQPIDGQPIVIEERNVGQSGRFLSPQAAFDGVMYRLVWVARSSSGRRTLFTRRVGIDGSLVSKPRRLRARGMAAFLGEINVSCLRNGQCLVSWGTGFTVQGLRVVGDHTLDRDALPLGSNLREHATTSNGVDYLVGGTRRLSGCGLSFCGNEAVVARISSLGMPIDGTPISVSNPPSGDVPRVLRVALGFDGAQYLVLFTHTATCGSEVYGARMGMDGTVFNPDAPGGLVHMGGSVGTVFVAPTRTAAVTAWNDTRPLQPCGVTNFRSVYAQRALPHPDRFEGESVSIGTIGPRLVAEQAFLRLQLTAPGLDPAATVFSASNLPAGAVFDAATGGFQWKPNPDEAGVYPGVRFEATDGNQTSSEDVTITVNEGSLALCGTVERLGEAVPNVTLELKGRGGRPRLVSSDAGGRFCFYYMISGDYTLRVGKPSRKEYGATPLRVIVSGSDVTNVQFVVRRIS
jgi:hypothetical protein